MVLVFLSLPSFVANTCLGFLFLFLLPKHILVLQNLWHFLKKPTISSTDEARVHFRIWVRVRVRVRDLAAIKKIIKNIFIYTFYIFLLLKYS